MALVPNENAAAGVKRNVTQAALNESAKKAKVAKVMRSFIQESSASQIWKVPEGDDFFDVKTKETLAKPTELTDNEIVFDVAGGDKYLMLSSLRFYLKISVQKKNGDNWTAVPADEILCVKLG